MNCDCHMHMILDGYDWRSAIARHAQLPEDGFIREILSRYQALGYTYLRDGGDRWGAGARARELAKEYGILDNVDFLGFQSNPLKILYSSSSMIMVSRWEGTPMCALEAMALGVPIVSTPVDGLKVLVAQDANGYLSDDDGELAKRVVEIATDPALRERLSEDTLAKAKILNDTQVYTERLLRAYGE